MGRPCSRDLYDRAEAEDSSGVLADVLTDNLERLWNLADGVTVCVPLDAAVAPVGARRGSDYDPASRS